MDRPLESGVEFSPAEIGPDVTVIIPCFNEAATIAGVTRRVLECGHQSGLQLELIVVDDGSRDGTAQVLSALSYSGLRVVTHAVNRGKGCALQTGVALARGRVVLFQDADYEYSPEDIPALIAPILEGRADAVFGSRFSAQNATPVRPAGTPRGYWHLKGNQTLTRVSNALSGLKLTDVACGYKAFRRELLLSLAIAERGFGVEAELTAKLARLNPAPRLVEVPTQYYPRTKAQGKKIRWWDGLVALRCIFQYSIFQYSRQPAASSRAKLSAMLNAPTEPDTVWRAQTVD